MSDVYGAFWPYQQQFHPPTPRERAKAARQAAIRPLLRRAEALEADAKALRKAAELAMIDDETLLEGTLAEIETVERLLTLTPAEDILGKLSLEYRRAQLLLDTTRAEAMRVTCKPEDPKP